MDIKFLDTYALIEISKGNVNFLKYVKTKFVILDLILAEFYSVLLRETDEEIAEYWYKKFEAFALISPKEILKKAVKFRYEHRSEDLSFFDCVGYIYSIENNMNFVTGDRGFKDKEGVEFLK